MVRLAGEARVVAEARALFAASSWRQCVERLTAADAEEPLDGEGLLLLGQAAYLIGEDQRSATAFGRAYHRFLDAGNVRAATRSAAWASLTLENAREPVRSRAWAARAEQLVEEHRLGGAEAAWMVAYRAHDQFADQRLDEALSTARDGERLGLAAGDPDAVVLSRLTVAFVHLVRGERPEAVRVLDEVMLAVSSDETSPVVVGMTYCISVAACVRLRDVVRARAWTATLDRWCAARPDLVAYRGTCLVHRAQMSALGGDWALALGEAATAQSLLEGTAAGLAAYQLGELHRLMGDDADAEDAYRRANALGVQPEPGLSLLRTAQGRPEVAARTLRRLCAEPRPPEDRAELLAARAEAELAVGDVDSALVTAGELSDIAGALTTPLLCGLADQAQGAVLLAADRPDEALRAVQRAQARWGELDMPHACAQSRVLAGRCLRVLGDDESAALEFEAARECFERLGAAPDLSRVDGPTGAGRPALETPGGLTDREIEVVRLVAAGHTNRAIAGLLFLSEKTVARHLANVYAKLDVPSRAAATAYAYDHGLV
ncbi:MAG TPA: helix-turn-helix transcriptional regulator [Blastococcus sp.]|nr:helix-turn-helix transcriptional regulator [Blastococcus sp.]